MGSDVATSTYGDNCRHYKLSYGPSNTGQSGVFGWYWGAANGGSFQIEGHKAWLAVPKSAGASTRSFGMDGESIDIVEINTSRDEEDVYYDLQGHRVLRPTSRGIYIHQGKKFIIK